MDFTIEVRGRRLVDVISLVPESVSGYACCHWLQKAVAKTGLDGQIAPALSCVELISRTYQLACALILKTIRACQILVDESSEAQSEVPDSKR